jgi:hypothetical protein
MSPKRPNPRTYLKRAKKLRRKFIKNKEHLWTKPLEAEIMAGLIDKQDALGWLKGKLAWNSYAEDYRLLSSL